MKYAQHQTFLLQSAADASEWIGADVDTTFPLGGPGVVNTTMYLFGDTFYGRYSPAANARVQDGVAMPHSSLGIAVTDTDGVASMTFHFNFSHGSTNPSPVFMPLDANPTKDYFWIVQGTAVSNESAGIVILADRIRNSPDPGPLSFITVATSVIALGDWTLPMDDWRYTTCDLPGTGESLDGVMWVTAHATTPTDPDFTYLFGSRNMPAGSCAVPQAILLMKIPLSDLAVCDFSSAQFLLCTSAGGCSPGDANYWGSSLPSNGSDFYPLMPIALPEGTAHFHDELQLWIMAAIPFLSNSIQLWYAPTLEGPWSLHPDPLLNIPAPWSDSAFFSYAPKLHATLPWAPPNTGLSGLPFSFVSNSFNVSDLFQPGFSQIYVPQFYRMVVTNGTA